MTEKPETHRVQETTKEVPKLCFKGVNYTCQFLENKVKTWSSRNLVSSVLKPMLAMLFIES